MVKIMFYFIFGKKSDPVKDDKKAKNILEGLDDGQMIDLLG
jgi:hypothetical protein